MFKISRQIKFATNSTSLFHSTNFLKHKLHKRMINNNNNNNNNLSLLKRYYEKEKYKQPLLINLVNKRTVTYNNGNNNNVTAPNPREKSGSIIERKKFKEYNELSFKQKGLIIIKLRKDRYIYSLYIK